MFCMELKNAAIKEAMVMLQLKHTGLVEFLDLWMGIDLKQQHTVNILMEYCDAGDLYDYVTKARSSIPQSEVVRLINDVLVRFHDTPSESFSARIRVES